MAQLTFQVKVTIPDELVADMRDTLAAGWGYLETVDDGNGNQIPNPETKIQFATAYIRQRATADTADFIRNSYKKIKTSQLSALSVEPDLS